MIVNLVTNAIKYTDEGCVSIRVSCTHHEYGINLSVSVADTGIGITPENLEKLFSSFRQVDTKKNRSVEGTGLGLAISKRLVNQMGGFINVSSEYGKGSEFRFVVPLKVKKDVPFISVKDPEKIHIAGYFDKTKFTASVAAEAYANLIQELSDSLKVDITLCKSMHELKKNTRIFKYTHIFTAREEYLQNKAFFDSMTGKCEVILIQNRSGAVEPKEGIRCIYKPFYVLSAAALLNHEHIATNQDKRAVSSVKFAAPDAKVLVVDDNEINLRVAVGLMRPYRMQVSTASSAKAAVAMLKTQDFDIVFMDHMMPEIDGIEATKLIRDMDGDYFKKLPIIALTANAVNGAREMFINEGMNDFVAKPIELTALDRALKIWLPHELITTPQEAEAIERTRLPVKDTGELLQPDKGIFYIGGDESSYREILRIYVRKGKKNLDFLRRLCSERSWKNYIIEVHALKSSSLTIGSPKLSEFAKKLELAGKAGNFDLIEKDNEKFLMLYSKVMDAARKYLSESSDAPDHETSSHEQLTEMRSDAALLLTEEIIAACSSFDSDEIAKLCREFIGASYRGLDLGMLFDDVRALAEDFEYDEASERAGFIAEELRRLEADI